MKRMGIDDQIKAAIQDLVAPARQRRRPPRRQDRLDSLAAQMGHMRGEHVAELRRVDASRAARYAPGERPPDARSTYVGLALSGGGIRSATFSLGLLQGMHRLGVLRAVDYLSTVSGGGFTGSWWTAWLNREHPASPEP